MGGRGHCSLLLFFVLFKQRVMSKPFRIKQYRTLTRKHGGWRGTGGSSHKIQRSTSRTGGALGRAVRYSNRIDAIACHPPRLFAHPISRILDSFRSSPGGAMAQRLSRSTFKAVLPTPNKPLTFNSHSSLSVSITRQS